MIDVEVMQAEPCPEDPSGHGLHWRALTDRPEWCRACGREDTPENLVSGAEQHGTRRFAIGQDYGPFPKPQDRTDAEDSLEPITSKHREVTATQPAPTIEDEDPEIVYKPALKARAQIVLAKSRHTLPRTIVDHLCVMEDWVPSHALQSRNLLCLDGVSRWVGSSGSRRCRELAAAGIIEVRNPGKYAEYRYPLV